VSEVTQAYARGTQLFMGLELEVAPGALVPREETELLARLALEVATTLGPAPIIVDMCTGSGNLACALGTALPAAKIWACDLTSDCVELSRRNVARHGLAERVQVRQGDLFAALSGDELEASVDLVVCNPPYISTGKLAERDDLAIEPKEAFDGGPYGLSIHQRVIKEALQFLKPSGYLLFEHGLGQDRQLRLLLERARMYDPILASANLAGELRVVSAKRKNPQP